VERFTWAGGGELTGLLEETGVAVLATADNEARRSGCEEILVASFCCRFLYSANDICNNVKYSVVQ